MPKTPPSRLCFALVAAVLVLITGRNLYRRYLNNALINAVEAKDAAKVRSLLDRGAYVRSEQPSANGKETVEPLLSLAMGEIRASVTDSGTTPPEQIACLLIEHGAYSRRDDTASPGYLQTAANDGSIPVLRCLLEHGADANSTARNYEAALDSALSYEKYGGMYYLADAPQVAPSEAARRTRVSHEMVALLRQHGARFTPLQAVQMKDVRLLDQTLQEGAGADEANRNAAALDAAAGQGNVPAIQILLAHGADPNIKPSYFGPALNAAAGGSRSHASLAAIKLLLDHGAKVNVTGQDFDPPLVVAINNKHPDIARLLLANHADPGLERGADNDLGNALTAAARSLPELVPELLAHHADINADDGAALRAAISAHHPDLVRYLLAHGAKTYPASTHAALKTDYTKGNAKALMPVFTPSTLRTAVTEGPESFDLLIQAGATLGADKADILLAASAGHAALFDRLIALGANVNAVDGTGSTPLTQALKYAPAGVQTLLEHGANINAMTMGLTPLSIVAQAGNTDLTRLLLAHGADVNLKPPHGHTPLYHARRHRNADILRLLEQAAQKRNDPARQEK